MVVSDVTFEGHVQSQPRRVRSILPPVAQHTVGALFVDDHFSSSSG